ncbi:hypothetical protein [uncultured Kordia sp.]|nr:hypothetical protein [uncultured Kordia sp.]
MKKKKLQSLKLNKKTISKANAIVVRGGGPSAPQSDCVSHCLGWECHDHK